MNLSFRIPTFPACGGLFRRINDTSIELSGESTTSYSTSSYRRLEPHDLLAHEPMWIARPVIDEIEGTIGAQHAEQGGMLGGRRNRGVITDFYFDQSADRSRVTYSPDTDSLRPMLRDAWNPAGIDLLGFGHSHPAGSRRPSQGDLVYAERILQAIPAMDRMVMPIVQTRCDTGTFTMRAFIAERSGGGVRIRDADLAVLETREPGVLVDEAFDRVRDAYDLSALASTRLVAIGAGGASSFFEGMARAGVGEFVLIDPDTVELPNIGTQQTYRRDIGRPKIDAIADRILDINPHARVVGLQTRLENLDDDAMARLVHRPLPNTTTVGPASTILCAFTDNFWAQARVNRVALHLGVPMVAAQVYERGSGVELSFHVPGRSLACGRCALGSRYRAFLAGPAPAVVGSAGTPFWATERLNEIKAQVVLAVAHGITEGDPEHPGRRRYERLLDRIATKNLVQVRLDPDATMPAFSRALADADPERIVTDDTLWLPQAPENPETGFDPCGDCGGTGDLTAVIGSFSDTSLPRAPKVRRLSAGRPLSV